MEAAKNLTKHSPGSIRELWTISMPLMVSILATLLMVFVDRCFLAHYSIQALNAAINSGTLAWAFLGGICTLTAMSEVFVSQYNGADQKHLIGVPVWQMIWITLLSLMLFVPLSFWGHNLFSDDVGDVVLQSHYFKTLIIFGPSYALITAFSGFYIGQGKTRLLIVLAVASNLLNAVLDWAFIFGVPGLVPEMGITGAALATGIGASSQALILGILFFRKKNRENYGTMNWKFDLEICKKCLKVGGPPALYVFLEIIGWTVFFMMMTAMGEKYITISAICSSLIILFTFYFEGLSRGVVALSGNFIGAKRFDSVYKVVKSGLALQLLFTLGVLLLLSFYPSIIVQFFGSNEALMDPHVSNNIALTPELRNCLVLTACYIGFEGFRWVFSGVLTAAGDTLFILVMGSIAVWTFLLLPLYLIVVRNHLAIEIAWLITACFGLVLCLFFWMRYRTEKWKQIDLLKDSNTTSKDGGESILSE